MSVFSFARRIAAIATNIFAVNETGERMRKAKTAPNAFHTQASSQQQASVKAVNCWTCNEMSLSWVYECWMDFCALCAPSENAQKPNHLKNWLKDISFYTKNKELLQTQSEMCECVCARASQISPIFFCSSLFCFTFVFRTQKRARNKNRNMWTIRDACMRMGILHQLILKSISSCIRSELIDVHAFSC